MNAKSENKSGWQFFVGKVFRWLFLIVGAIATFLAGQFLYFRFTENSVPAEKTLYTLVNLTAIVFCLWLLSPILRWIYPPFIRLVEHFYHWFFTWQTIRRVLITLAVFATLIALFYTEEDWRGKRAWENCKRELEVRGEVLDWNAYIPPPVADAQNFFKAPKMAEWFVGRGRSELSKRLQTTNEALTASVGGGVATNLIATAAAARNYLSWSDQFRPDFNLMREALKLPYARMDGDYSVPYAVPIPNFLTVRAVAQMLSQRAHCYLLLDEPEKALDELTLLNDSRRLLEGAPTGKPMTLVAAMINVAVSGLYVNTIAEGFQKQVWQEPQLVALQNQLGHINLSPFVVQAFESEPAATTQTLETAPRAKIREWFSYGWKVGWWGKITNLKWILVPRGWIYQNMATDAKLVYQQTEGFDVANNVIHPKKFEDLTRELNAIARPYKFIAVESIPNYTRAWQTLAHYQTSVNEAQIACALERYRLAHNKYPETLEALVPLFIEKLPHDIIGGQPLKYRRMVDGKFLLYSIGWNETDDGGQEALPNPNGGIDYAKGDWVWKN